MTSDKKLWARYAHMDQIDKMSPADVFLGEKQFSKKYGVESSALMKNFPITKEVFDFVNTQYNKLAEKNSDKNLEVTFDASQQS